MKLATHASHWLRAWSRSLAALCEKRVTLLGEAWHGDGWTFEFKATAKPHAEKTLGLEGR